MTWVLTLAAAWAGTGPTPPRLGEVSADITRSMSQACFPSGLQVTLREDHRQPVVAITTVVDGGARRDPAGREGVAHLAEHLWFESRPVDKQATVAQRLRALGAAWNAVTMNDVTVFMTEAPVDGLDALLKLEASRLQRPLGGVDATVFGHERSVVGSESTLKGGLYTEDLPRLVPGLVATQAGGLLAPESAASAAAITLADVTAATGTWKPSTVSLYVSGDFDASTVVDRLQALWPQDLLFRDKSGQLPAEGSCPSRVVKRAWTPPPARPASRPPVVRHAVDRPWLLYGWLLPGGFGGTDPLRELAALRLEESLWTVKLAQGDDVGPACTYLPGLDMSSIVCQVPLLAGVSPDGLDKKLRAALSTASSLSTDPSFQQWVFGYSVHRRLQTEWSLSQLSALRGSDAMLDAMVAHFTTAPDWFTGVLSTYPRLDASGLGAFLKDWLREEQALTSLLVSPGTDVSALYARQGGADVSGERPPDPTERPASVVAHHDNLTGADIDATLALPPVRLATPVAKKLPSGLDVVVVPHGEDQRVRVGLHVPMGPAWTASSPGLDEWLRWMTGVSLESWPIQQSAIGPITATALQSGARWWGMSDEDSYARGLRGGSGNLEQMLWLLRLWVDSLVVLQPTSGELQSTTTWLGGLQLEPWAAAAVWRGGQVLGATHPLAMSTVERLKAGSKTGYAGLQRRLQEVWRPDKARLVIVGDVDAAYASQLGHYMFSSWIGKGAAPTWSRTPAQPAAQGAVRKVYTDPDRGSTTVSLSCPVAAAAPAATAVTEHVLAKAMQRGFRDSDLAAYDPSAWIGRYGPGPMLELSATVRAEDATAAMDKLEALVRWASSTGPSAANVADSGRQIARSLPMSLVHTDDVYAMAARLGGDVRTVVEGFGATAVATQPAVVMELVKPCAASMAVTAVGP